MKAVSLGKQKKKSLPWRIVSGLANTALLVILALFVYLFLAFPMQMKGHSMEPAAAEKSLLLLNKIQYRFVSPKQFDVIAFQIKDSDELQIKRIIACPGDRISIKEGMIYINGTLCEQANEYSKDLINAGTASDEGEKNAPSRKRKYWYGIKGSDCGKSLVCRRVISFIPPFIENWIDRKQ